MFQTYAVTYSLPHTTQEFGTTCLVDLDEAKALGREEMGTAQRELMRKAIAIRALSSRDRFQEVVLTEVVRLGGPTETP